MRHQKTSYNLPLLKNSSVTLATPTSYDSNEATQLQQAVLLSQQMQYGITQSGAGSSSGAYTTPAYGNCLFSPSAARLKGAVVVDLLQPAYEPDEDESTTPKGGAISADEDQFEEMDPSKNLHLPPGRKTAPLTRIVSRISNRAILEVSARGGESLALLRIP